MADKQFYDANGNPIGTAPASAVPSRNYFDINGSPIQLNPSGVKQPIGSESYTPQTQGSAETAAPYAGRLAANTMPVAGSMLFGPGGTVGGVGVKQLLQRLAPNLFGEAGDPIWDALESVTMNDAIPGVLPGAAKAAMSPVKTLTRALVGTGKVGSVLRGFPAAREGMVRELSGQLTGQFSPPAETRILDDAAQTSGNAFDNLSERVRGLMDGGGFSEDKVPLTKVENTYIPVKPKLLPAPPEPILPPKPETFAKPGTNGKTLSDKSQLALDNWNAQVKQIQQDYKKSLAETATKNKQLQADADLANKTRAKQRAAYEAKFGEQQQTSSDITTSQLRGGDIFPPHIEDKIQELHDLYGDNTIGDALLKLRNQTGDLTKSQPYKDITRRVLGDVTGVQNFKVLAGPMATEQLALNKLLAGSEGGINGKGILTELNGKNLEIYREALSPETYGSFKNLVGEIATQQQKGTGDRLLNWASGKLKFMAPLALVHGTLPTGTGVLGGVALTNSMIAKAMSNPETAQLVVEAMRTPVGTPKANLISHALSGVFQANNSIPANLLRVGGDIATVPEK